MSRNTMQQKQKLRFSRRSLLKNASAGFCAASVASLTPGLIKNAFAEETPLSQPQHLIVSGVANGSCGQWAQILAPALADNLHVPLFTLKNTLGWDGITAANLFETQQQQAQSPAGLIIPGTAILAELGGDSRVHYDYLRWIPTLITCQPTVAVGRISLHRSFSQMLNNHPLRIAVSDYTGRELPSLLALDLLKLHPLPLRGFGTTESAIDALLSNTVDVIQIPVDSSYTAQITSLKEKGFNPLFTNSLYENNLPGNVMPPLFGTLCAQERPRALSDPLYKVWYTSAAASTMKTGLMLPFLSLPAQVAKWRQACHEAALMPAIQSHAKSENETIKTGAECITAYVNMKTSTSTTMAFRRWLALNIPRWQNAQTVLKTSLKRDGGEAVPSQNPG